MKKLVDGWWFSRHLKLKDSDFKIDVEFEMIKKPPYYRMFTDDLKYGEHLEILFDNKEQYFIIKDIDKLRADWKLAHPEEVTPVDDVFEELLMER